MPEGKDLCLELGPSSESLPNRRKQHENDREHVACKLQLSPFKFNWLNENGVFGRDSIIDRLAVPSGERAEPATAHNFPQNGRGLFEASVPIDFFEFVRW